MTAIVRTGDTYISIEILRSTYQQLKDLAGSDLPPEKYLESLINQMSTGTTLEHLKTASTVMNNSLNEIMDKLAGIADSLRLLTEITLEKRSTRENTQGSFSPKPPDQLGASGSGFTRPVRPGETQKPGWERPPYPSQFYDNQVIPSSPPANVLDDAGGEESASLEGKIKKYEEENPW
jgi:hypothetical protein